MTPTKTDEEHLVFLEDFAALQVRFALAWTLGHPGSSLDRVLEDRTFLFNLTAWHRGEIYDLPEADEAGRAAWDAFRASALRAAAPHLAPGDPDLDAAEAAVLACLPPSAVIFEPRVVRDQAELHHPVRGLAARAGCLWTFAEPSLLADAGAPASLRVLEFHIANHRYPESFLKDPASVRTEVRNLALRARSLGFDALGTRSWLNDHPAWLACFPPVWIQRLSARDFDQVGPHLGCWGQAVTARQTLSPRAEAFVRSEGRFELAMRSSWMTVDEALG